MVKTKQVENRRSERVRHLDKPVYVSKTKKAGKVKAALGGRKKKSAKALTPAEQRERAAALLGRHVKKDFDGSEFVGVITAMDAEEGSKRRIFRVVYEDGDEEDLYYEEAAAILRDESEPEVELPYQRHIANCGTSAYKIMAVRTEELEEGFYLVKRDTKPARRQKGYFVRAHWFTRDPKTGVFEMEKKACQINLDAVLPVPGLSLTAGNLLTVEDEERIKTAIEEATS